MKSLFLKEQVALFAKKFSSFVSSHLINGDRELILDQYKNMF